MSKNKFNSIYKGDILVKCHDGKVTSRVIAFAQSFGTGPSKYTHAGIASSSTSIIEMSGAGIGENGLMERNAQYVYDVFRCKDTEVAAGAAEAARMMMDRARFWKTGTDGSLLNVTGSFKDGRSKLSGPVSYNMFGAKGAARAIFSRAKLKDRDNTNRIIDRLYDGGYSFFCSGHVVLCYQMVAEQLAIQGVVNSELRNTFKLESHAYQPAYLWHRLKKSQAFDFVGTFQNGKKIA
ncbi:hypothetical protein [Limoniibacter endophyticus]|uniref:Uncharacterized protein n=1 Tax=Limoniibacter endophyticus TaxID=1565040 RepID=A0A8J3GFR4_9HYPH|nr:hypothetical protein [Limoniibacter endophyticus]GHC64456.1 hypothetical protein GCM10010136_06420 [Limoniibacter endophyticus]